VSESFDSRTRVEHRRAQRRRVVLSGIVFVPKTHSIFDCWIRDLSETGARIDVRAGALIPIRFQLINIKDQIAYEVQCVRRNGPEMAVTMLRSIPLADASSSEALQLRRLLVERLQR
jgi:hypothetical protein